MSIEAAVRERFERSFGLYRDLIASIGEPTIGSRLGELPSNTVGAQLWCVVGARESYSRAIEAGRWAGFAIDLLEHEAAHQGQLIRYLYALKLTIPPSWKARYALT